MFCVGRRLENGYVDAALFLPRLTLRQPRVALRLHDSDGRFSWEVYPAGLLDSEPLRLGTWIEAQGTAHTITRYAARYRGWLLYVRQMALARDCLLGGLLNENGVFIEIPMNEAAATPTEALFEFPGTPYNFMGIARMLGAEEDRCPWLSDYHQVLSASAASFVLQMPPTSRTAASAASSASS